MPCGGAYHEVWPPRLLSHVQAQVQVQVVTDPQPPHPHITRSIQWASVETDRGMGRSQSLRAEVPIPMDTFHVCSYMVATYRITNDADPSAINRLLLLAVSKLHNQATATPDRQEPGHTDDGPQTHEHTEQATGQVQVRGHTHHSPLSRLASCNPQPHTATQPAADRPTLAGAASSLEGEEVLSRKGALMPKHPPTTMPSICVHHKEFFLFSSSSSISSYNVLIVDEP